jgi:predicted aspartyl protease
MDHTRRNFSAALLSVCPLMAGGGRAKSISPSESGNSRRTRVADNSGSEIDWIRVLDDPETAVRLPVSLEGVSAIATLDTGVSTTIVDSRLASRFGITPVSSATVRGNVNAARGAWGSAVKVTLGNAVIQLPRVMLLDLTAASSPSGTPIEVILGYDIFGGGILDIDLAARRIAFRSAATFRPETEADRLLLGRGSSGERYVLASIEGHEPIPATLDLGSSSPVMLSARYATAERLLVGKRASSAAIAGVDGINVTTTTSLKSVGLGPSILVDVPCEVFPNWYSPTVLANLGLPFLSRFRLALDFTGNRAWIVPAAGPLARAFQREMSGLGIAIKPDRLLVVHVSLNSPAAAQHWVAGDIIVAVNGLPVTPDYFKSPQSRWRYGPEGQNVELTLLGGSKRELKLKRYY